MKVVNGGFWVLEEMKKMKVKEEEEFRWL
ncbi:hypothetical protein A2U01_0058087, partial [Trifolium medium]|nr:hypothetical protein [Trifolium medium]